MGKANIIFAEDDSLLRSIYLKKFSLAGYDVRPASDGEEAVNMITQSPPDILVLDINMPKVDGFQVLERFPRASRKFPIILLTNFDQEDCRTRAKNLGADEFLVKKDMTIRSLLTMVETLLAQKK